MKLVLLMGSSTEKLNDQSSASVGELKEGIHAQRGTCADCHMPYISKGGVKFTDHQINSPLAKIVLVKTVTVK